MDFFLVRGHFYNQSRAGILKEPLAAEKNIEVGSIGVNFHKLDVGNATRFKNAVHGYEVTAHLGSCAFVNQLNYVAKAIPGNGL